MNVTCDGCKREFLIDLKIRTLDGDIEENYFVCPHCNKEYTSFKTNFITRRIQEELNEEIEKYKKVTTKGNIKAANKKWNKIQKLKKKHKIEMMKIN